ncbi:hypothetical protein EVAR_64343_1 [Eumeta japonica]|uniref:Uncharacterized protein n=1 Tax=Eumeta variegata TaxID=151549 RepID=A0A4C1ZNW6_EUMVA|nr:hypothetical protein EVAR_64343_1 [Eumeta japonica]
MSSAARADTRLIQRRNSINTTKLIGGVICMVIGTARRRLARPLPSSLARPPTSTAAADFAPATSARAQRVFSRPSEYLRSQLRYGRTKARGTFYARIVVIIFGNDAGRLAF